ncbi:WecB/TagA/CpsF family glycosyltransferase [Emticicia sp. CRIBPO]|uniref:WecB/TagA/CpsF family glycosyltransferase n=1 Tax=Emticicia sp. CRIBPO TaxID=2683258 RepID=UPI0014124D00|nr:WecB/TagA/CpsF family glycosyltransferase [Emticicia sp. CRIBPO]NBA85273.1 WecB/TagA/CpsF family glycosyltransferase [Emticicia sp. CRIBPO]
MRKNFLNLQISLGSYDDILNEIISLAKFKTSSYVCVANVHMLVETHLNSEFLDVVNNSEICTTDGMPLVKGLKFLYNLNQERVAGMDLLPDLLAKSESKNIPVYFYGGTQEMLDKTKIYCESSYPDLIISGLWSPPFRALTIDEEQEIIDKINDSKAKFVFVALGCPKQEKWMASMQGRINACMIGIGGALPVMIGMQKRAPLWMQKASLEWLYRLMQEPKRLFKRYAVTNSIFIYLLFKQWARQGFRPARD